MGIQWTADIRDRVCLVLLQHGYSSLRTDEQTLLDGGISAGSLPVGIPDKGVARDALMKIRQLAQWYEEAGVVDTTGSTTGPSVWEPLLIQESVFLLAQALRPNDLGRYAAIRNETWLNAIDNYGVNSIADSSQLFGLASLSPQRVRLHVNRVLSRRRPRVLVPVAEIDMALRWAIDQIWDARVSLFRTRHVTITIPTASEGQTPTVTLIDGASMPSGEVIDSVLSTRLRYTDTVGRNTGSYIRWGLVDEFTEHRADQLVTGRPEIFRFERRGGSTLAWRWSPTPDAQYTVQAVVLVKSPAMPSAATDTAVLGKLPSEFDTLVLDLTLGKVAQKFQITGYSDDYRAAMDGLNQMPAKDRASAPPALAQSDVYGDHDAQPGRRGSEYGLGWIQGGV